MSNSTVEDVRVDTNEILRHILSMADDRMANELFDLVTYRQSAGSHATIELRSAIKGSTDRLIIRVGLTENAVEVSIECAWISGTESATSVCWEPTEEDLPVHLERVLETFFDRLDDADETAPGPGLRVGFQRPDQYQDETEAA